MVVLPPVFVMVLPAEGEGENVIFSMNVDGIQVAEVSNQMKCLFQVPLLADTFSQ